MNSFFFLVGSFIILHDCIYVLSAGCYWMVAIDEALQSVSILLFFDSCNLFWIMSCTFSHITYDLLFIILFKRCCSLRKVSSEVRIQWPDKSKKWSKQLGIFKAFLKHLKMLSDNRFFWDEFFKFLTSQLLLLLLVT